ncbi:MAG TPA: hypothetical protein VFZ61_11035 [Polyangiales bacterium]
MNSTEPATATATPATPAAPATPSLAATALGLGAIFLQGCLLLLAGLLTAFAFVWFVPEVNDYHLASVLKHDRLSSLKSPKIVLTGGSNLAFGIDSPMIEQATGLPVVNMGMDGYLGVEFLLAEVEPELEPTDVVVVALEHDSYIIPPEGVPESQLAIVKANPSALKYLTAPQRQALFKSLLLVAQAKVKRLIEDTGRTLQKQFMGIESASQMAEHIGRFEGFIKQGDFTSHLDVQYPEAPADGLDLGSKPPGPITKLLREFNQRMRAKGVRVLFSYPPVAQPYFARHSASIAAIHAGLAADADVFAPTAPSEFVYPADRFFDTVYHVTRQAREARTRRLLQDIQQLLERTPPASGSLQRAENE